MSELDKNKTCMTHRATAVAATYLDLRGFKPIETEVPVFDGWVADLASYVYPSPTELHKLKLVGKNETRYGTIIDSDAVKSIESLYGGGPFTAIVEVKVTKADCKKDLDFKFAGRLFPAHLCYLAYPKGLLEKPPKGWIGLVLNDRCDRLVKVELSSHFWQMHPQHPGTIIDVIAQIGIRRHHRTRNKELRDFVKAYNADETKRKRTYTMHSALKVIEEYLFGEDEKNITEMIRYHGITHATAKGWIDKVASRIKNHIKTS